MARVHRSRFEQEVPEPLVEFRSGPARQISNFTNRQSVGIVVDADLARLLVFHVRKMCGLNSFLRSQQIAESLNARVTSIRHCGQQKSDFNLRLLSHVFHSIRDASSPTHGARASRSSDSSHFTAAGSSRSGGGGCAGSRFREEGSGGDRFNQPHPGMWCRTLCSRCRTVGRCRVVAQSQQSEDDQRDEHRQPIHPVAGGQSDGSRRPQGRRRGQTDDVALVSQDAARAEEADAGEPSSGPAGWSVRR